MLSEQTLLNAAVLTVDATSHNKALAGIVFNVLLIARAPLQLFQAIQTSLLPHLTGLEATAGHDGVRARDPHHDPRDRGLRRGRRARPAAIGPFVLGHVFFGQHYTYSRFGLALIGVGMGLHLTSGALNQAALARDRARAAARLLAARGGRVPRWMLTPAVTEQLLRAEIGYAGATALLALMLARSTASGPARARRLARGSEPRRRARRSDRAVGLAGVGARRRSPSRRRTRSRRPARQRGRGVGVDAAVDLDRDVRADERAQPRDLLERVLDERLPAPARVDGHAQRQVDRVARPPPAPRRASPGLIATPTHAPRSRIRLAV